MNVRKGLFRIWVVISVLWALVVGTVSFFQDGTLTLGQAFGFGYIGVLGDCGIVGMSMSISKENRHKAFLDSFSTDSRDKAFYARSECALLLGQVRKRRTFSFEEATNPNLPYKTEEPAPRQTESGTGAQQKAGKPWEEYSQPQSGGGGIFDDLPDAPDARLEPKDRYVAHYEARFSQVREQRIGSAQAFVGAVFGILLLPPLILFGIGFAVLWAAEGFKRQ